MAISFVGYVNTAFTAGYTTAQTVNLNLTGGIDTQPRSGDIIVVSYAVGYTTALTPSVTGYTTVVSKTAGAFNASTGLFIGYKIAGASETTLTLDAHGGTAATGASASIFVFRGVDMTTPLDVAAVSASVTNSAKPTPPAITPVTSGAVILLVGAGAHSMDYQEFTDTNSLSVFARLWGVSTGRDVVLGMGYKSWAGGTLTPTIYTFSTTDSIYWSNCSASIALRPAVTVTINSLFFGSNF